MDSNSSDQETCLLVLSSLQNRLRQLLCVLLPPLAKKPVLRKPWCGFAPLCSLKTRPRRTNPSFTTKDLSLEPNNFSHFKSHDKQTNVPKAVELSIMICSLASAYPQTTEDEHYVFRLSFPVLTYKKKKIQDRSLVVPVCPKPQDHHPVSASLRLLQKLQV